MQVDDPVVERGCACRQIQIPHTDEPVVKHCFHLVQMFQVILSPAAKRTVIMETEILDIHGVEIIFRHGSDHLAQAGHHTARED